MHARAFTVAGAVKTDLLADLYKEVLKGVKDGVSIQEFRKNFDSIVKKYGWNYNGNRNWRTGVIFNTNMTVAYAVGRYKQMTDPDVLAAFPYWRYRTMDDNRVRPQHRAWNNIVLRYDDPWWDGHYPPRDFGCRCEVQNLSGKDVERLKAKEAVQTTAPDDGTYNWRNPTTGAIEEIPNGVGPGWNYNLGESAWGKPMAESAMSEWQAGANNWERLITDNYEDYGRPETIPLSATDTTPGIIAANKAEIKQIIEKVIGGQEKTYFYPAGDFTYSMVVNAEVLGEHLSADRSPFLVYLPEALENPYEIWLSAEKNTATGKVALRQRIIKGFDIGKGKGMLIVFQTLDGYMEAWTSIYMSDLKYLNNQRQGKLIWQES